MQPEEMVERFALLSLTLAQALDHDDMEEAGSLLDAREEVLTDLEQTDWDLPEPLLGRMRAAEARATEAVDRARRRITDAIRVEDRTRVAVNAYASSSR